MLASEGIVPIRRNHRELRHLAHGHPGALFMLFPLSQSSMSMKMAMRRMTRLSMVSSNWDDSLGSEHLPSIIYALAETARDEVASFSHPRRSTFTARRSVNVAVNGLEPTQDRGYSELPSA